MGPLRILVAEDDALVAEDLRQTLLDMGHQVAAVVHTGDEAAEEARAHSVELALLDIHMPGAADGIEVGRRLTQELDIPVVFVTAYADDTTVRRALKSDPMGYVVKPVDPRQLRTAIELAARRHARERRILQSVREVRRAHSVLRRSELRYRTLFAGSPAAIYIVGLEDGRIRDVNGRFSDLFGWRPADVVGQSTDTFALWPLAPDRRELGALLERDGLVPPKRVPCRTRSGEPLEVEVSVERTVLDDEACLLLLCRDVDDRAAHDAELERLALYDSLTGLPNRNLFRDRLKQSLERGRREDRQVAVLFVDLDRFKIVNDTLGHAAGDQVLSMAGERLRTCFRDEDTVARLAGDEFAVVVVEKDRDGNGAEAAARRIHKALQRPFDVGGVEIRLQASVGIAFAPRHASSVSDLVRFSDAAMFAAKGTGGGDHRIYEADQDLAKPSEVEVAEELDAAIEGQELVLHFQPLAALETGRIVGAEALVRWNHPTRGLLAPAAFVPLADEKGYSVRLGRRVLDLALGHLAAWEDRLPPDFSLCVNLSPRHVGHPEVATELGELLETHGVAPQRLALEITESAVVLAPYRLRELRELGVRVALDDFGTGRSPLTHLSDLEIDIVKLDRALVSRLGRRWADFVIARSVILCAEGLGLDIVAEGVETREQAKALVELGCPMGQGHLIARPMDADAFGELLLRPSPREPE